VGRREQADLERFPGYLPVHGVREPALDLGAHRRRVDKRGRDQHDQCREDDHGTEGVGQPLHALIDFLPRDVAR